jgi:hypothetical protein
MTKREWESETIVRKMIEFALMSPRKRRLFEVACAKHVMHLITDGGAKKAIEVAERYADNNATWFELHDGYRYAYEAGKKEENWQCNLLRHMVKPIWKT